MPDWKSEIVLVPRSWCLLITVSLDSSEMGIRLISGKYQEKVLDFFYADSHTLFISSEKKAGESRICGRKNKLARRCVKRGLEKMW